MAGMSFSAMPTFVPNVVMQPMLNEVGWSRSLFSMGPMVIGLMTLCCSTGTGYLIDRVGARRVAFVALALLICAMVAMGLGGHLFPVWAGAWAVVGLASSAVPSMWLVPVTSRFIAARGLAMAVVLAGPGIGSALTPIVANWLVEHYGWRSAFLGMAAVWGVVTVPLVLFFLRQAAATAQASPASDAATLTGLTVAQGFRTPAFYKILVAAFCGHAAGTGLILNLMPVLNWSGLPRGTSALIASSLGVANILGGITGGWLLDRFSPRLLGAAASAIGLVFPMALLFARGSVPVTTGALFIYGMIGGTTYPAVTYLTSRYIGTRSFGTMFGTIHALQVLAVGLAPVLANRVFDVTHSYALAVWAAVPLMLLAVAMFLSLGPMPSFEKGAAADQP
jgi:MFS family permease